MKKVGRYDIISELGRGAMGIVYKASDPTIDREVALKVLSLSATTDEAGNSAQQMFMREVRAAGRLTHPSIVTIHDAFDDQENQTSCIVMEMVPGVTLEKIIDSGQRLSVEESLNLIRQVVDGLDYAHRHQVIHRDLKPANILVTEDGLAKITDFGIAKVLAREGVARTVGIMGTPSFMSPEQVKGGEIDARTDIFSLGIMLYTLLTGKKPFVGNTAAVMFQIVYEEPPNTSHLNPELNSSHDYVVNKCLAKDRGKRYTTARELLSDLEDLQYGRPPRSQSASPAPEAPAAGSDRTMAMSIQDLMKSAGAKPAVLPSHTTESLNPPEAPPVEHTMAMPIPSLKKATPQPVPRPAPPAQEAAPPPKPPVLPEMPVAERTMAMPIPKLMKATPQPVPRPAPPAPSQQAAAPAVPPQQPEAPPIDRTVAMSVPSLMKSVAPPQQAAPPHQPPAPPPAPPTDKTVAMSIPSLMKGAAQPPAQGVIAAHPPAPAKPAPAAAAKPEPRELTVPRHVPDLSGSSAVPQPPPPPRPAAPLPTAPPPGQQTAVLSVPEVSPPPVAAGPLAPPRPPATQPVSEEAAHEDEAAAAHAPAAKSNLIPILASIAAIALVTVLAWVFIGNRSAKTPAPAAQAAVQAPPAQPASSAQTTNANPSPPPPPPAATSQPSQAENSARVVPRKTVVGKPKTAAAPVASAPASTPAPEQPQPAATAPPQPVIPAPTPAPVAKPEAPKFANVPRIVQVSCDFGFKEATFTFTSSGQTLYSDTLKGKKKKGGFLGLKGSYLGNFSHTITVPAGASEVSVHVEAKEGSTDLNKTIKMPAPGGFVPTLAVEVDTDHLLLNWQSASTSK